MQLSWAITMQISRVKPGNQKDGAGRWGGGRKGGREGEREGGREGGR